MKQASMPLRDSNGRFTKNAKRSIAITERMFKRYDQSNTHFHMSESWVSNNVWAIRKECVKNLALFIDMAKSLCHNYHDRSDADFLKITNYEKTEYFKTDYLRDFRHTEQNCMTRIFKNANGECILINDALVSSFEIESIMWGGFEKCFTTPDQAFMIMPFSGEAGVKIL